MDTTPDAIRIRAMCEMLTAQLDVIEIVIDQLSDYMRGETADAINSGYGFRPEKDQVMFALDNIVNGVCIIRDYERKLENQHKIVREIEEEEN